MKRKFAISLAIGLIVGGLVATDITYAKPKTYVVALAKTSGGFVPAQYNFSRLPRFVVYSDGRMISESQISTQQYPGRAIPNLMTKNVSFDLKRIVSALENTNLANPKFDWGYPSVADVPNTEVITQLSAKKRSATISIYALGMTGPGLTKKQVEYRKKADRVLDSLQAFSGRYIWSKSYPTKWTPTKYVYQVAEAAVTENSNTLDWVGPELSQEVSCAALNNSQSAAINTIESSINVETLWSSGGKTWRVTLRPLLPHESGCKSIGY